jgi:hypothetical protein
MEEVQIRPCSGTRVQSSPKLPIDLLDGCGIESLTKGRTILSLVAILDHFRHALLIEGAFEENGVRILDKLREGFSKAIRGEVGCPNQE